MNRALTRMIIITKVSEFIAKELKVTLNDARDMFYTSSVCRLLEDEETGLYGESPYRTFELFMKEYRKSK